MSAGPHSDAPDAAAPVPSLLTELASNAAVTLAAATGSSSAYRWSCQAVSISVRL